MEAKWYVVRTFSGQEQKIKSTIESDVIEAGLQANILQVMVPSEKVFEVKGGKKKTKTKTFFPGYILIEAILNDKAKHLILNTNGVLNFIGTKERPTPLQPDEVRRLIGKMEEKTTEVEKVETPFNVGDAVKVMGGPFNNFSGFIQEINKEKLKVKVMVSIFGRKTPVELDFTQIELEKH